MRIEDGLRQAALEYAALGYRVFPCAEGRKTPIAGTHGVLDATSDEETIDACWARYPRANVGLATDGLLVIDIDVDVDAVAGGHDGDHAADRTAIANAWARAHADRLAALVGTPQQITASGGVHCIFRQPSGEDWRNTAGAIADRVDTRASGGYIVVAPSRLAAGGEYRWVPGHELDRAPGELPEPPGWIVEMLAAARRPTRARRGASGDDVASAGDPWRRKIAAGKRNMVLASRAGTMRRLGMSSPPVARTAPHEPASFL